MDEINWNAFKAWKQTRIEQGVEKSNLAFLASYVRAVSNAQFDEDVYEVIINDSLGRQMLEKQQISGLNGFCFYMHKHKYTG